MNNEETLFFFVDLFFSAQSDFLIYCTVAPKISIVFRIKQVVSFIKKKIILLFLNANENKFKFIHSKVSFILNGLG